MKRLALLLSLLLVGCPTSNTVRLDFDGDGALDADDCDPADPDIFPGTDDPYGDGVDQDCDGLDGLDADQDGWVANVDGAADCNDGDPTVHPGAADDPEDVEDTNCDGHPGVDGDGDGWAVNEADAPDCDDTDPDVHPEAGDDPLGDGIDSDCDGSDGVDRDGDGYPANDPSANDYDCNDADPAIHPGAEDPPGDGVDSDCDPSTEAGTDADGDGYPAGWSDCDDVDPAVHIGATELADGVDQDCDGLIDEGTAAVDRDGDGYCVGADLGGTGLTCSDGALPGDCDDTAALVSPEDGDTDGVSGCAGDCNDNAPNQTPNAVESCDGVDNDCDGAVPADESDLDGDGQRPCGGDCDDLEAAVFAGATELCDAQDSNCDGSIVDGFLDSDADLSPDCTDPDDDDDGVNDGLDCAPFDPAIWPGAPEGCDTIDSNCDGSLVDGFSDADGDLDPDCTDPDDDDDGALDAADCAPFDAGVYPGAAESCDLVDQDCDGNVLESFANTDGDAQPDCVDPDDDGDGSPDGADCAPLDPTVHPLAAEVCDGLDGDCSGAPAAFEVDGDSDGFMPCEGDCDDQAGTVYPGAPELCDGLDNPCASVPPLSEADQDLDGSRLCDGDCDDANDQVLPGAAEICDGIDNDCDAGSPEPPPSACSYQEIHTPLIFNGNFGCGLTDAGRVICWGSNGFANIGLPPTTEFLTFDVTEGQGCGIRASDQRIECWSGGVTGVAGPPAGPWTEVVVGQVVGCALGPAGVACWGTPFNGLTSPPGGTYLDIGIANQFACGVLDDGSAVTWGSGASTMHQPPPGDFVAVSCGGNNPGSSGTYGVTCAIDTLGALTCWGLEPNTSFGGPLLSPPAGDFVDVAVGGYHACALDTSRELTCWGLDITFGAGVPAGPWAQVDAGFWSTCAVRPSGAGECWGLDGNVVPIP
jgi:hypothetical protein